jgi:hypothetical protein
MRAPPTFTLLLLCGQSRGGASPSYFVCNEKYFGVALKLTHPVTRVRSQRKIRNNAERGAHCPFFVVLHP